MSVQTILMWEYSTFDSLKIWSCTYLGTSSRESIFGYRKPNGFNDNWILGYDLGKEISCYCDVELAGRKWKGRYKDATKLHAYEIHIIIMLLYIYIIGVII